MSEFWSSFPRVLAGLGRVRARLHRQAELLPSELRDELAPLLQREGKALRAGLILMAAGHDAGPRQDAVDAAAAAVELLHLATLVHDDIVDQAPLRRGEPALHQKLGPQKAVLYGDLLFSAAFRTVTRDVGVESARALADVVSAMAVSEIEQWNERFRLPPSPRRILRKTMGKTALLFSLSLYVGASEAKRPDPLARSLRRSGYALGMAFQLQDDLLDWTGSEFHLGKPVLEDLAAGVYTLPVATAWQRDPQGTAEELSQVRMGQVATQSLRDRWHERSIWSETRSLVDSYAARARSDWDRALVDHPSERQEWERFLTVLLKRHS